MLCLRNFRFIAFPLCGLVLLASLITPAVVFADGPAVDGPNAKFSFEGGQFDGERSGIALGSFTMPLSNALGLQVDGAIGRIDEDTLAGGGLHLFTRDPSSYLFGVYGSIHDWNSIQIWRAAAEFELYVNRFSIEGIAGYESVDVPLFDNGLQVLNTDDNHFFGHVDLAYYPLDDLKLYAGYRYVNEASLGAAGVEYLLRDHGSPISLFAKGHFGDSDHTRVTAGLKIYFGADADKSLINRHRTEDPQNRLPVFSRLRKQSAQSTVALPICLVTGQFDDVVTGTPQDCICPAGTRNAGGAPSQFQTFASCGE